MRPKLSSLRKHRVQALLATGAAVVGFAGLAFAQVPPAMADPTVTLVAVGSDTIQDVYNQFGLDESGNLLGSYNAVNPVTAAAHEIITPNDGTAGVGCSFVRPNGSGEGVANLRLAINPASTNASKAVKPAAQQGCVDIARSSGGPDLPSVTGPLVYIPFALDAVAGSTGGTATGTAYNYTYTGATDSTQHTVSVTPVATVITTADQFTLNDLKTLYGSCAPVTEGGITYDPTGTISGDTKIDLYVPQAGSGTRSFWATTLVFNGTTLPSCVHDTIIGGPLATATGGVPVEEHNGTPITSDPNGFGPFSIAQWISQRNGHDDRRHGAVLHNLAPCTTTTSCGTAVSPFSNGNPATGSLNTNFPIVRDVYSVVSYTRVTTSTDPLFNLLNGQNSFLCTELSAIVSYGFATIGTNCGAVLASNRVLG